jgi:hypothetical protein
MVLNRKRSYDESAVKNALLDHAFRATLHRLRGVQSLLVGWAEIGAGGEDAPRLKHHFVECGTQLARLEWLHGARTLDLSLARLAGGESPKVLLAAAAFNSTPEEVQGEPLPVISTPEAALALALWLEAQRPVDEPLVARFHFIDGCLSVRCENGVAVKMEAWQKQWRRHLETANADGSVRFHGSCFRPAVLEAPAENES